MRYKNELLILLGLVGSMLLYIHTPSIPVLGQKVIKLTDDRLLLVLPPTTGFVELRFKNSVNVRHITITPVREGQDVSHGVSGEINGYRNIVKIIPGELADSHTLIGAKEVRVDLAFSKQFPHPEITEASIDGANADLPRFYEDYIRSAASRLIATREIRDDISQVLRKYNENISNYVISLMVAVAALLFVYLIFKLPKVYLTTDQTLVKKIKRIHEVGGEDIEDHLEEAKCRIGYEYAKINRWSKIIQVIGPALGFTLTVSSLIVALYPTVYSGADITIFFNAIQIAMISTFIGLLLRIEAIAIQAMNNSWLMRFDEAFSSLSSCVSDKGEPSAQEDD